MKEKFFSWLKRFWACTKCLFGIHAWSTRLDLEVFTGATEPYYTRQFGFLCTACGSVDVIDAMGRRIRVHRKDVAGLPEARSQ